MNKLDLKVVLAKKLVVPQSKADEIVECVLDTMTKALQNGERVELRGFGSFTVRSYKAYQGRNPRTGKPVSVKPKKQPFFKAGKELKDRLNKNNTLT